MSAPGPDKTARLLALALAAALVGAIASSGDVQPLQLARSQTRESHPRVPTPVAAMPQRQLERVARHLTVHGGVLGTCYGCATHYLKVVSDELVVRAFPPWARSWAACVAIRESGLNPGAISSSDDYGLPQIHVAAHPEYASWRLTHDPVYAVAAFARLSQHGANRHPWDGGSYAC